MSPKCGPDYWLARADCWACQARVSVPSVEGKLAALYKVVCRAAALQAPTSCSLVMLGIVSHAAVWLVRRPQQREHQGRACLGAAAAKAKGQVCLQRVL